MLREGAERLYCPPFFVGFYAESGSLQLVSNSVVVRNHLNVQILGSQPLISCEMNGAQRSEAASRKYMTGEVANIGIHFDDI